MRILLASHWSLLDTTNGASISMRALLHMLAKQGVESRVVSDSYTTAAMQAPKILRRRDAKGVRIEPVRTHNQRAYQRIVDGPIEHRVLSQIRPTDVSARNALVSEMVEDEIEAFAPHALIILGGCQIEDALVECARRHGLPSMLFVVAPSFMPAKQSAQRADMVVGVSEFTRREVEAQLGVRCEVSYPVNVEERYICGERRPQYVTFINPEPEKGLALFSQLVEVARRCAPELQFLVVEGRSKRENIDQTNLGLSGAPNVAFEPNRADVRSIYAKTSVLLFPSVWPEAFGMAVVEAQANGIPVLAHDVGGVAEAMNDGGDLFDVPRGCRSDFYRIPGRSAVEPWLERLCELTADRRSRADAERRARAAARRFSSVRTTREALQLIRRVAG